MPKMSINDELLDFVNGGSLGWNPEPGGNTYTMICQYSGEQYQGVPLSQVIEVAKFSATIPDTPEGEKQIVQWARDNNIIH